MGLMGIKYITLRVNPRGDYENRKKQLLLISKLYSKREGRKISINQARNLLIIETAAKKSI